MQLRVYGHFTGAEIAAMSDEEWARNMAHLLYMREEEYKKNPFLR